MNTKIILSFNLETHITRPELIHGVEALMSFRRERDVNSGGQLLWK
jgi:hypothetical protein